MKVVASWRKSVSNVSPKIPHEAIARSSRLPPPASHNPVLTIAQEQRAGEALQYFEDTGNPLFALDALAHWPNDWLLADSLRVYLAESFAEIAEVARAIKFGAKDRPAPDKIVDRIPAALGLLGTRGRGRGAVADYRKFWTVFRATRGEGLAPGGAETVAAAIYADAISRPSSLKDADFYAELGGRIGISGPTFKRLLAKAKTSGIAIPRKPRPKRAAQGS